jgi:hypothetical protein
MYRYEINDAGNKMNCRKEKQFSHSNTYNKDDCTYFMSSIMDSAGALWLLTYSTGVWKYNPSTTPGTGGKNITHYPVKNGDAVVTLFSIYKDHEGVLWLGTHTDGAYRFNGKTFEKFKP